jgi:hypothetical protein
MDEEPKSSSTVHDGTTLKYIAKRSDCGQCSLKPHCSSGRERRVQRDVNQEAREYAQTLMDTEGCRKSATDRKKIERLFGEIKHIHVVDRLSLRDHPPVPDTSDRRRQ